MCFKISGFRRCLQWWLLSFQGVVDCIAFSQGGALGYGLTGLSGRLQNHIHADLWQNPLNS